MKAFIIFVIWCATLYYVFVLATRIGWTAGIQCIEESQGNQDKINYCKYVGKGGK